MVKLPPGSSYAANEAAKWAPIMIFLFLPLLFLSCPASAAGVTREEALQLRDEVRDMFYHAFDGYMQHAFPMDELRPLSCSGEDSLGGYALTLVDSLDMLALLRDRNAFSTAVEWLGKNLRFDKNKTVSVFETNIRVLGGLLSAHLIAKDSATGLQIDSYEDELLHLAEDLGRRLLPAFETPTGIPYGSVNLLHGVNNDESKVTSTAGGGTLTLEFGVLSRLSKDPVFETVARNAVRGLWAQRSQLGLVGAHINVFSGEWTHKDAGIGTSIDSFYEYLLKAYLLFGDEEYLYIFNEAYKAVMQYLHNEPWYLEVNMNSAVVVWPLFNSLQAFWPGLQVLAGDLEPARHTHKAFFSVWKRYGFTPEGFNLATSSVQVNLLGSMVVILDVTCVPSKGYMSLLHAMLKMLVWCSTCFVSSCLLKHFVQVQPGQRSYPLRPELIESTYWLYKATRDSMYLDVGRDMVASIQYGARCPCGYCHIADVESHAQEDHMESFFLAETVKYLWLLFDLAVDGDNLVEKGPYPYIFSTEGHYFPMTPEISLLGEHCTYLGSFCNESSQSGDIWWLQNSRMGDSSAFKTQVYNESMCSSWASEGFGDGSDKPGISSALLKGVCPGVGYWERRGVVLGEGMSAQEEKQHVKVAKSLRERLVDLLQSSELRKVLIREDTGEITEAQDVAEPSVEDSSDNDMIQGEQ